jgi:hypothetical protein
MSLLQLEDSGFIVASSWPQNPFIGRIFKTNKYGDTIQSVKTNTWCNIVKTHDQNFAYAGGSTLLGQGRLTKIDDSLNEMWTQYYPQFISISVTASNDSGFILNSSSSIIKTDSLGAVQWTGYFSGTIRRIIPCVNGDILVVGMYAGSTPN